MSLFLLKYSLFLLAGIANAVMDTLVHHHSTSVFKKKTSGWWADAAITWRNKYKMSDPRYGRKRFLGVVIPVYLLSGWHFCKLIMILSVSGAASIPTQDLKWYWEMGVCLVLWWIGFEGFYSYILRRK